MLAAKTTSVDVQPNASMRALPMGGYRNWQKEPAAVPAQKATGRQGSGRSLLKAPSTRLKEQPASPKPTSTPAPRWSIPGVEACDMTTRPRA